MGNLSSICLRVYFSEEISEADFIIANSGLLRLFVEQSEEISDKTESLNYAHVCRTNLETALFNLPLHLPATPLMISALLLGVSNFPYHSDIIHFISQRTHRLSIPSKSQSHHFAGPYRQKHLSYARLSATIGSLLQRKVLSLRRRSMGNSFSGSPISSTRACRYAWGGPRRFKTGTLPPR